MDLARLTEAHPDDKLYDLAKKQFETANTIQTGTASYNLACIYALRNDQDACLKALENAKERGSLPDADEMLNDPDLNNVKEQAWFSAFIEPLNKKPEVDPKQEAVAEEAVSEEILAEEETEQ
jgi:hypothetical protein